MVLYQSDSPFFALGVFLLDALAEFTKSLLIPGTLTFLLFGVTLGVAMMWATSRLRPLGKWWVTALVLCYWLASVPRLADSLATRFHAADATPITSDRLDGVQAIVVLGAGIRTAYSVAGHTMVVPDAQTIFNAVEGARIYRLVPGGLPVVASGGRRDDIPEDATESRILTTWLTRAGVPADRIIEESGSRTTREQAKLVMPLLKSRGWTRFVLITPAVQGPRAAQVFRLHGGDPIIAAAPFWGPGDRREPPGWLPNGGALRVSERATYDYLAWAYYWMRGWLRRAD